MLRCEAAAERRLDTSNPGRTCAAANAVNGQVEVSAGGQLKVPAPRVRFVNDARILQASPTRLSGFAGVTSSGLFHAVGMAVGDDDVAVVQEPKARRFVDSWMSPGRNPRVTWAGSVTARPVRSTHRPQSSSTLHPVHVPAHRPLTAETRCLTEGDPARDRAGPVAGRPGAGAGTGSDLDAGRAPAGQRRTSRRGYCFAGGRLDARGYPAVVTGRGALSHRRRACQARLRRLPVAARTSPAIGEETG
jgi:hypothetical protein